MDSNTKPKRTRPEVTQGTIEAVVQRIRPLPANVIPSEAFQAQMKLRLLHLEAEQRGRSEKRAA